MKVLLLVAALFGLACAGDYGKKNEVIKHVEYNAGYQEHGYTSSYVYHGRYPGKGEATCKRLFDLSEVKLIRKIIEFAHLSNGIGWVWLGLAWKGYEGRRSAEIPMFVTQPSEWLKSVK